MVRITKEGMIIGSSRYLLRAICDQAVYVFLMLAFLAFDAATGFRTPSLFLEKGQPQKVCFSTTRKDTTLRSATHLRQLGYALKLRMAGSDVTDLTFKKEILESKVLTIVSFWAPWCGPCRMIKPVLDEIEFDYRGKVKIAMVNTDENQQTAVEYGIRSIPTLILFKDGVRLETIIGAVPKATLEAKLAQNL